MWRLRPALRLPYIEMHDVRTVLIKIPALRCPLGKGKVLMGKYM
jgi:hypothetical protein